MVRQLFRVNDFGGATLEFPLLCGAKSLSPNEIFRDIFARLFEITNVPNDDDDLC